MRPANPGCPICRGDGGAETDCNDQIVYCECQTEQLSANKYAELAAELRKAVECDRETFDPHGPYLESSEVVGVLYGDNAGPVPTILAALDLAANIERRIVDAGLAVFGYANKRCDYWIARSGPDEVIASRMTEIIRAALLPSETEAPK